jgi:hypothetical protein
MLGHEGQGIIHIEFKKQLNYTSEFDITFDPPQAEAFSTTHTCTTVAAAQRTCRLTTFVRKIFDTRRPLNLLSNHRL